MAGKVDLGFIGRARRNGGSIVLTIPQEIIAVQRIKENDMLKVNLSKVKKQEG